MNGVGIRADKRAKRKSRSVRRALRRQRDYQIAEVRWVRACLRAFDGEGENEYASLQEAVLQVQRERKLANAAHPPAAEE